MKRIEWLDLWRTLCVILMILYHTAYDLSLFGIFPASLPARPAARWYAYLTAGGFILISGMAVRFSQNPILRGFKVFACGVVVTVATALAGRPAVFGILHLLGCCMLLYGLLRERLDSISGPVLATACLALFAGTRALTASVTVGVRFLFPLGFRYAGFYSSDYFPLFPWMFLFFAATAFGKRLYARRDAPRKRIPPALTFCGRHSLLIYLLHQPLIYGMCRVFWGKR